MSAELTKRFPFLTELKAPVYPVIGRALEIDCLREPLLKKRMRNVMILGHAGVGKTELVRAVAQLERKQYRFYELNVGHLMSDTRYRGTFEKKFYDAINAIEKEEALTERRAVLFIDEAHMALRAGATEGSDEISLGNMLKPMLSDGSIIIWGATTIDEYRKTLAKDTAFARRFGVVSVPELDKDVVLKILKNFAENEVLDDILDSVYEESQKIAYGHQPDISIELLDRAMARAKLRKTPINKGMLVSLVESMSATGL